MKRRAFHYEIRDLIPYIDWSYVFHAWGVGDSGRSGIAMQETRCDAEMILKELDGRYRIHALFALCDARSEGDNIMIGGTLFPMLRQQHAQEGKPNLCLSDFVSPKGCKLGLFATSTEAEFGKEYRDDIYKNLIVQILADRLAEAAATRLHKEVRTDKELWGYAPDEVLTTEDMLMERHQGIRPAVGYPSLPDQSVIFIIDRLLELREIGIELTPNGAMFPHASVCGLMFSHPAAHYFAVGKISEGQLRDYAARRGIPADELRKYLSKNIG